MFQAKCFNVCEDAHFSHIFNSKGNYENADNIIAGPFVFILYCIGRSVSRQLVKLEYSEGVHI